MPKESNLRSTWSIRDRTTKEPYHRYAVFDRIQTTQLTDRADAQLTEIQWDVALRNGSLEDHEIPPRAWEGHIQYTPIGRQVDRVDECRFDKWTRDEPALRVFDGKAFDEDFDEVFAEKSGDESDSSDSEGKNVIRKGLAHGGRGKLKGRLQSGAGHGAVLGESNEVTYGARCAGSRVEGGAVAAAVATFMMKTRSKSLPTGLNG